MAKLNVFVDYVERIALFPSSDLLNRHSVCLQCYLLQNKIFKNNDKLAATLSAANTSLL